MLCGLSDSRTNPPRHSNCPLALSHLSGWHSRAQRIKQPASMVVQTSDSFLFMRSDAHVPVLRPGGQWSVVAARLEIVPQPIRDQLYRLVARTCSLLFGWRDQVCPILPPQWWAQFNP